MSRLICEDLEFMNGLPLSVNQLDNYESRKYLIYE